MKGLIYRGEKLLECGDVPIPSPAAKEVLIRVAYTGVCGSDLLIWHGAYPRVSPPRVIGHEFSGIIAMKGKAVNGWEEGDRVVVEPLTTCGECSSCLSGRYNLCRKLGLIGMDSDGAMAEFLLASAEKLIKVPERVSLMDAAFVEPIAVCVHVVAKSKVEKGMNALVVGGGPIGLITACVLRLQGVEVFLSEINPFRIAAAREQGFTVINPRECELNEQLIQQLGVEGIDASFEVTGTSVGLADCVNNTRVGGTVAIVGMAKKLIELDSYKVLARELTLVGSRVYTLSDFRTALSLIDQGLFEPKRLISKVVSLEQVVEEGFVAIDKGAPIMKVMVEIGGESS